MEEEELEEETGLPQTLTWGHVSPTSAVAPTRLAPSLAAKGRLTPKYKVGESIAWMLCNMLFDSII